MDRPAKQRTERTERSACDSARGLLWRLSLLSLLVACAACEKPTTRLIEIREVTRDDETRSLALTGRGFPGARAGEAQLSGTLYRPGAAARSVQSSLPCHALSDELLRVDLKTPEGERLDDGLFEGRIEVHFPSNAGSSEVVGSIAGVRIRFERAGKADLSADLLLARRARSFQQHLGALEVESTAHGLTITRIAKESLLERAGLEVGDRIERINGAPIERVRDLLPQDERGEHLLHVTRKQSGARERIRIAAPGHESAHESPLAAFAFLIALGAGALMPASRSAATRGVSSVTLAGAVLTALSFLMFGLPQLALDVPLFYGLPLLCCLAVLGLAFTRKQVSGVVALQQVLRLSATSLALSGLAILSGKMNNPWLGVSDAALPIHWTLLSAPPAWLALFVLHAARPTPVRLAYWAPMTAWLGLSCAVCAVSLAAGAGTLPHPALSVSDSILLALLIFAVKVALVHTLLSQAAINMPQSLLVICALLCPLGAWAFLSLTFPVDSIATFGALGLGFWLARTVLGRVQSQRVSVRDPALAPFL